MSPVLSKLPTKYGEFTITIYPAEKGLESVVLSTPKLDTSKTVLVRIHDECMTGDTFGSLKCDCGEQKEKSLQMIAESGNGLFIYMRQEGRGIGLYEKIKAYALQDEGYDTHEADIKLGHKPDSREYDIAKDILVELGISEINLITNNPFKVNQLKKLGIKVQERIPLVIQSNAHNENYIQTKKVKFQHTFDEEKHEYFVGVNGVDTIAQVKEIAQFTHTYKIDSSAKIYISNDTLYLNSLSDENTLLKTEEIFTEVEKYKDLFPVLHYSFKHSVNPMDDLEMIAEKMQYVKHIQLDDLNTDFVDVLKYTTDKYSVIFPLTDSIFETLLDNEDFIDVVLEKKVPILLDNSCGKGVRESAEKYKEKILKCLDKGINNIALAGGFSPDYLDTYFETLDYFKINISIDAASGLHTNNVFDVEKAKKYIGNVLAQKYL